MLGARVKLSGSITCVLKNTNDLTVKAVERALMKKEHQYLDCPIGRFYFKEHFVIKNSGEEIEVHFKDIMIDMRQRELEDLKKLDQRETEKVVAEDVVKMLELLVLPEARKQQTSLSLPDDCIVHVADKSGAAFTKATLRVDKNFIIELMDIFEVAKFKEISRYFSGMGISRETVSERILILASTGMIKLDKKYSEYLKAS